MFKTKIVEKIVRFELFLTVIGQLNKSDQYGRHSKTRFFQNWILRNTHRHQPFDFYEIAELCKTLVAELRKSFANGNPMSKLEQIIRQKVKIMQWKLNRKTTKSILSGVLKDELKKYAGQNAVKI